MSDLAEILSKRIAESPRLRGVPIPVVEEVVREVFYAIELTMADDATIKMLLGEWDECESCGDLGMADLMVRDEDEPGLLLCQDCATEETASEGEQS